MATNRRVRWIAAGAIAVAMIGWIAWALAPQPVIVQAGKVARGAFERTVDEDGKTRVRERYVVSAPLAGRLLRVELKPGAHVATGALVATLVPAAPTLLDARAEQELTERVGVADAEQQRADSVVERERVALELARSELARQRDLAGRGFTSQQALERAERDAQLKEKDLAVAAFNRHAAEHQRSLARAALTRARSARAHTGERWDIQSPIDGTVLRVLQESESVVALGAPILELGDPANLEVVVDVLTSDASQIHSGAAARLDPGNGTAALPGRVRMVEPSAFTKVSALGIEEQRVNVVIDLAGAREAWAKLGDAYRVDAHIVVEERSDALLVPAGALFRHGSDWAVYVIESGRARLRAVELGTRNASQAVVLRGLATGDEIVVYPSDSVHDGARVAPRGG